MAEVKNAPEVRLKGFSGAWVEKYIHEVANRYDNLRIPISASNRVPGSTPYYGANGIQGYIDGYTHDGEFILLAEDGANDLKNYPVIHVNGKVWVNNHAHVLQGIEGKLNNLFLKSAFSKVNFEPFLVGGGRAKLNAEVMMGISLNIPQSTAEQAQIGTFFKSLDNQITLKQHKLDKLVTLKKAMLEKLFPKEGADEPEIRFKGFSGAWSECFFDEQVDLYSGLTYSPSNIVSSDGTLVLRSSNIQNDEIVFDDNVYVDSNVVNCSNVEQGDIVIVVRNGSRALIGKSGLVKAPMENTVIGAFMTGIRAKQFEFIKALLDTNHFKKQVDKNLGATINQITNGAFKSMSFMFPREDEQKAIGSYFQKLDNLISLQKNELTKLKQIKSACLEKMFV